VITSNKFKIAYLVIILFSIGITSCIPKRKLVYLQDQKKDEYKDIYLNVRPEKKIQPFDNVYIKVSSIDDRTASIFSTAAQNTVNVDLISYTVDQSGYINFPFVGEIFVKNMTLREAQQKIEEEVGQYLPNISITVKFVNNRVAVLGEVTRPGEYAFYRDQITIFQALSYAGDFTDYGNKEDVILIREAKNEINYYYLDLTEKDIVGSPYYYIIPNDVIIVKPIKQKFRNLGMVNWPIYLTTITTAVTLYLIFAPRNN
jgi:polysaccharide export outer membrane protein